ncbi:hypothetical protein AVEN_198906-1 [Araneus ventricosus]|uniref:Uncharacterized protein n=1 Tax=Araneus ventricosus TaxID=182803 RepID=A0A4Y2QCA5_ARAVE|nr:hypothetical protein AVEN_198906-1 [Araneus ventricosus]
MAAVTARILRKLTFSPNPSGRVTLTKKAYAGGLKSITLYERVRQFHGDIRTFGTATVFCLRRRLGRSRIVTVKNGFQLSEIARLNLDAGQSVLCLLDTMCRTLACFE